MADQFTEVKTTSYGSRISGSIRGIIVGFLMFVAAFILLYWNEGRIDLSTIAKKSVVVDANATNSSLNGQLISVTGNFSSPEKIGDGLFLKSGNFIAVKRVIDMYAWDESSERETKDNLGGSQTETTTYTYKKRWVSVMSVKDSTEFKVPEGHENPKPSMDNYSRKVGTAKLGIYSLDMSNLVLPSFSRLSLNDQNITLRQGNNLIDDQYIYVKKGSGNYTTPQLGDLRVSYQVVYANTNATVFGKLEGASVLPYFERNTKLYHALMGDRETAIAALHAQYRFWIWIFRLIGFALMWLGLMGMFSIIGVVLSIIPVFGDIGAASMEALTFLTALVLSTVTILVSMVFHRPWILLAVLVVGIYLVFRKSLQKKKHKKK